VSIDWITVGAQIFNFLVLAWLLKRFLYGPITRAMDRREAEIQDRAREATTRAATAEREACAAREAREGFERQRDRLLAGVQEEVEKQRSARIDELRREVEELKRKWMAEFQDERDKFGRAIRREVAEQLVGLIRRALTDLADVELEAQMVEVFLQRLALLDASAREQLAKAASSDGRVEVRSSFELPADLQGRVTAAIGKVIGSAPTIVYQRSRSITCGIELATGGRAVAWSIDGYLDGLEADLPGALGEFADRGGGR
jgi:F-type H+-transporting ATPase subunit b